MFTFLNLISYKAAAELISEAKRTFAGYLWWIIEPLFNLVVYYIVFKYIFKNPQQNFAVFLFCGIVSWRWFHSCVLRCSNCLVVNHPLMQLINVHKSIFPLSIAIVDLFKFSVTLPLVIVTALLCGYSIEWSYFALFIIIFVQFMLICGAGMIAASITPFFPDFHLVLMTVLQLMMFLSGVFYSIDKLTGWVGFIMRLNPMAVLIDQMRKVLFDNMWPDLATLSVVVVEAVICLLIGFFVLNKFNKVYPKLS